MLFKSRGQNDKQWNKKKYGSDLNKMPTSGFMSEYICESVCVCLCVCVCERWQDTVSVCAGERAGSSAKEAERGHRQR